VTDMREFQRHSKVASAAYFSVYLLVRGVLDFFRIDRLAQRAFRDPDILVKSFGCFLVSGGIFYGSHLAFLELIDYLESVHDTVVHTRVLEWLFRLVWQWPAYIAVVAVTSGWYHTIAVSTARLHQLESAQHVATMHNVVMASPSSLLTVRSAGNLAEDVYRTLVFVSTLCMCSSLGYMPYGGRILGTMLSAWLYAFYCFDYQWTLRSLSFSEKKLCLKKYWMYFVGFGIPMIAVPKTDWVVETAYMSCLFPIGVIQAAGLNPQHGTISQGVVYNAVDSIIAFHEFVQCWQHRDSLCW